MLLSALKPTLLKVLGSFGGSIIFGGGGLYLYLFSTCFEGRTCPAYSPSGIAVAYLLSWPVLLMQGIFVGSFRNFDSVLFGKSGWLILWAYYYLIASTASLGATLWKRRSLNGH